MNTIFTFRMKCNGASFLLFQTDKLTSFYRAVDQTALCVGCEYSVEIVIDSRSFEFALTDQNKDDVLRMIDVLYLVRGGK